MSGLLPMFVTPGLALAGALLVGVPILIHLLSRRRYRVIDWAAMDFLLRALRQTRRRMRMEQLLLLLTRCSVICLAGLALARPFGCGQSSLAALAGRRSGLHVLVIDNAMSMAYLADRPGARTNLDQAKLLAKRLIDRMSPGGESVVIVTAARPARSLTATPIYDLAQARQLVDSVQQTALECDLSGAMARAIEAARADAGEPNKELVLLTDGSRSTFAAQAESLAAAARQAATVFHVVHYNVGKSNEQNAAVTDLSAGSHIARVGFETDLSATVRGFGGALSGTLQWRVDGQPLGSAQSVRADSATPPITQPQAQFTTGGPHTVAATFNAGDRLAVDDTRWRVVNVAGDLKVLVVEGDRGLGGALGGSGAFLESALSPPPSTGASPAARRPGYLSVDRIGQLELPAKVLGDYAAIALADVSQVAPTEGDRLAEFVKAGGSLLIFMGDHVSPDNFNAVLLSRGLLPGPLTHRVGASGQAAHTFDFKPDTVSDPLLIAFAGQPRSGLDTAQVFTYFQVDPRPALHARRVLDYLPDSQGHRNPAITVQDLGIGHVVFVSTSADASWTTFPAKPAYVALMHELISGTIDARDQWMNLRVGQTVQVPLGIAMTAAPTLRDSRQQPLPLTAQHTADGKTVYQSPPIATPGIYTVWTGLRDWPIAVNTPAAASDLRMLGTDALRQALGGVDAIFLGDELPTQAQEDLSARDFGWVLMLGVLGLAALETALAKRFGRHRTMALTSPIATPLKAAGG